MMTRPAYDSRCIADELNRRRGLLADKMAAVGFDGYVDDIVRVVEKRPDSGHAEYFRTIGRFAERIAAAAGVSADLEIVCFQSKLGGNAPNMAIALTNLGLKTNCIGAMGYPQLHPVFYELQRQCNVRSVCQPSVATALEFDDGKVMLAGIGPLGELTWEHLLATVGLDVLREEVGNADVVALVNWSHLPGIVSIWEGLYKEVFQGNFYRKNRLFFFDLADPGNRTQKDIIGVLEIISCYSKLGRTVLGLNENESRVISIALGIGDETAAHGLEHVACAIRERSGIGTVVIHAIDRCCCSDESGEVVVPGRVVPRPSVSTGGGDNFNAGFCAGSVMGFDTAKSCLLGMAVSAFYVENGRSPTFEEWIARLKERGTDSLNGGLEK